MYIFHVFTGRNYKYSIKILCVLYAKARNMKSFSLNPLTKRRHNRKNKEKRFISIEKYVYTAIIGKYGKDKNSYVCLITLF